MAAHARGVVLVLGIAAAGCGGARSQAPVHHSSPVEATEPDAAPGEAQPVPADAHAAPVDAPAHAPATPAGPPAAFTWGVSQGLWGTERLTIEASGRAHYRFESARDRKKIERSHELPAGELSDLRDAVADPRFCKLVSKRDGIPDEGQPSLQVDDGSVHCTVTLWDGEWEQVPAALAAYKAIVVIIQDLRGD